MQVVFFLVASLSLVGSGTKLFKVVDSNKVIDRCFENGTIHLSFDDGPVPSRTNPLLDLLVKSNISASFFVNGDNYSPNLDHPDSRATLSRSINEGHAILHHTWSHRSLTSLSKEDIIEEMSLLSDKLNEILGFRPKLMRPPNGDLNDTVEEIIQEELGYTIILWSIDSRDWEKNVTKSLDIYRNAIDGTNPNETQGFIALHHDPLPMSVELVTHVIDYVKGTGYRFVDLHQCLGLDTHKIGH